MDTIVERIKIHAPAQDIYNQWMKFEQFPSFMRHVESVERLNEDCWRWTAIVAGKRVQWDSEITENCPPRRIAWRSTSGHRHAGTVEFRSLKDSLTELILVMAYECDSSFERIGNALRVVERQVMLDLEHFKHCVESGVNAPDIVKNRPSLRFLQRSAPRTAAGHAIPLSPEHWSVRR